MRRWVEAEDLPATEVDSYDVAWADLDGDGALELAFAGEGDGGGTWLFDGEPGSLAPAAPLDDGSYDDRGLAWGDFDADGDFGLAFASETGARVLHNLGDGSFHPAPVWEDEVGGQANAVAWGDVDGDGDVDLAVGYGADVDVGVRIYLNDSGALDASSIAWTFASEADITALAWGDLDGDGDLELALSSASAEVRVFTNTRGQLEELFQGEASGDAGAVAWGDVDADGDLDLAADGATGALVYTNDGGVLDPTPWAANPSATTVRGLAWGDSDGDGDLDLAVGGGQAYGLAVYDNIGGVLNPEPIATASIGSTPIQSLAWGDWAGVGQPVLAAATSALDDADPVWVLRLVEESLEVVWESEPTFVRSIAWADFDGDGDLDLAGASKGDDSAVWINHRRDPSGLASEAPQVHFVPDPSWPRAPSGFGQAVPSAMYSTFPLTVEVSDREADSVALQVEVGDGVGSWIQDPAWTVPDLSCSPEGWVTTLELPNFRNYFFGQGWHPIRVVVVPAPEATVASPTQQGLYGITSPPYRLRRDVCWPYDADEDGFSCTDDCDDQDPTVHPGADEVCDGVDSDCDGAPELDADGDGIRECDGDCDDADIDVHSGAAEACSDAGDVDCEGAAGADGPECWSSGCGCAQAKARAPTTGPSGGEGPRPLFAVCALALLALRRRRDGA
ncbi:MAG: hypothetical protein GY898_29045 [Proteobacteria bacterium]|nr:hypothetical protein [Pseudomonadota bacterium]